MDLELAIGISGSNPAYWWPFIKSQFIVYILKESLGSHVSTQKLSFQRNIEEKKNARFDVGNYTDSNQISSLNSRINYNLISIMNLKTVSNPLNLD